jgi:hypothetical protein
MRHVIQLLLGGLSFIGGVLCWQHVHRVVDVEPVANGEPPTTSVVYYPPLMFLTMLLVTTAGVLIVLGVTGLRRRRIPA